MALSNKAKIETHNHFSNDKCPQQVFWSRSGETKSPIEPCIFTAQKHGVNEHTQHGQWALFLLVLFSTLTTVN